MMPEINPASELRSLIIHEEQRILDSFPLERRFGLMEIARSMDLFWANLSMGIVQDTEQVREVSQLITFGLNKAIHLFLDSSCNLPGFPLAKSNEGAKQWADSVLIHCGRLGVCEHLLEVCRVGLRKLAYYMLRKCLDRIVFQGMQSLADMNLTYIEQQSEF